MLRRRSVMNFNRFIDCLCRSNQAHLAQLLLQHAVISKLNADLDETTVEDVHKTETELESQFGVLLPDCSEEQTERARIKARELSDELKRLGYDIRLIDLRKINSLAVYFRCTTLAALRRLWEFYSRDSLRRILESTLTSLLGGQQTVGIKRLVWREEDYKQCEQYFGQLSHLSSKAVLEGHFERREQTEALPVEIVEIVLMQAAVIMFRGLLKTTSRPDAVTLTTLNSVCADWWKIITGRDWNRRLLRRQFKHMCHPYSCHAASIASFRTQRRVCGVAQLGEEIYVVCYKSDSIQVFDSSGERRADVCAKGLKEPQDVVVCRDVQAVYVADYSWDGHYVWKMTDRSEVKQFISLLDPRSLSVTSSRLLVTTSNRLRQYGPDGDQLLLISLPDCMNPLHAVESNSDTFVVSHTGHSSNGDLQHKVNVSEIDVDGDVIRVCTEPIADPFRLALDAGGRVFICDGSSDRVLLLDKELQLERVVLSREHDKHRQPFRLCYVPETGCLLVVEEFGDCVKIYRLRR